MIDKAIVLRKLSELDIYRGQIKEYSGIKLETYKADWKIQRIVERTLQMIIETCADIAKPASPEMPEARSQRPV